MTEQKLLESGGVVGAVVKQSRWARLKSTSSEPPRSSPTHAGLSKAVSEAGSNVTCSQKPSPDAPKSSAGSVTVHVTNAESNTAKPEAKQPEAVALDELRSELHAVTEQMQRVEARLDIMFRMFTTFISGSGLKTGAGSCDMMGVEVVDLTGGVVRRSPDPRSRGNSMDMAAASVFSSRLNSVTSEDDVPVNDVPSNHTISTDVTLSLSPPLPKPIVLGSPTKPPTLVRVRPLPGSQATAAVAAMENPGFIASPDSHPGVADPARQARKSSSGASNAERPLAMDDQRTVSAQPVTSVCRNTVDTSLTSGLTTSATTVSGSSAPVVRSTSVHERLSVGHLPASVSAPSAEGIVDSPLIRSPPPPPMRRRSGAGSSPARGRPNDPRLRTTLV